MSNHKVAIHIAEDLIKKYGSEGAEIILYAALRVVIAENKPIGREK